MDYKKNYVDYEVVEENGTMWFVTPNQNHRPLSIAVSEKRLMGYVFEVFGINTPKNSPVMFRAKSGHLYDSMAEGRMLEHCKAVRMRRGG